MEDLGFREEEERGNECKIAQITFAYENGWMIDTLRKRGAAIAAEKYDKMEVINAEIHHKITTDSDFLDKCQLPCAVFVTFEGEEGCNRARIYNDTPQMKLLGEEIQVREAAEPTDIIWENREYSPLSRNIRTAIAWTVIVCLLGGSFIFIFEASVYGNHAKSLFPANANCKNTQDQWYKLMED